MVGLVTTVKDADVPLLTDLCAPVFCEIDPPNVASPPAVIVACDPTFTVLFSVTLPVVLMPEPSISVVPAKPVVREATDTACRNVATPVLFTVSAYGPVTVPANVRFPAWVLEKAASALSVTGSS